MQLARDRDSGPAAPPIPRSGAHCGRRRSVSRRPHCVEPVGGDQWKPVAEKAVSNRLSHMQCTGLRKFRNSAIESLRSISSHFQSPISAKVVDYFRRSKEFGIAHDGFTIEMSGVRDRKRKMVVGLNEMYMENYRTTGAEFILGSGRFVAPRTVEADLLDGSTRQLRGTNVIVSTGTRASLEPIPGLAEAQPLTHIEALELGQVPEHLLVIGGGYVGVELSQAMQRFGSKVTVIDRNGRLMSKEDPDVCEALRSLLADEGIDILLNARIKQVSGKCGDSVSVVVEQNGIEKVLKGSHVLVATGRNPNTEGLGLELTGVELTDRGYIKVNERLQTTAPSVWKIGEVAGSPQFTHISVDDFRVVHANLTGGNRVTTGRQVPYCLFTDPELARIGLSETEAEAESDRILGFTAFGVGAGETLAAVQIAMIAGLPYTALRDAVLTHPTLVEGLISLFSSAASAHHVVETRGAQISAA